MKKGLCISAQFGVHPHIRCMWSLLGTVAMCIVSCGAAPWARDTGELASRHHYKVNLINSAETT